MDDSEIIKTEIIRVLNENGKTRATELLKRVLKKIGNEKMIYREISSLVESGQIGKKIYDKSHIEYELIDLSKTANAQLKNLHYELESSLVQLQKFYDDTNRINIENHEKIRTIIEFIHIVQSIEGIMKLLSYYPVFKNDKMFSQINRKIFDYWEKIMEFINHQTDEEFLNNILSNIRIAKINSKNIN